MVRQQHGRKKKKQEGPTETMLEQVRRRHVDAERGSY